MTFLFAVRGIRKPIRARIVTLGCCVWAATGPLLWLAPAPAHADLSSEAIRTESECDVQVCEGDCDESGVVQASELVLAVNIVLGEKPLSACPWIDSNCDGAAKINEILQAINRALLGGGECDCIILGACQPPRPPFPLTRRVENDTLTAGQSSAAVIPSPRPTATALPSGE